MTRFPTFLLLLVLRFDFNVKVLHQNRGNAVGKAVAVKNGCYFSKIYKKAHNSLPPLLWNSSGNRLAQSSAAWLVGKCEACLCFFGAGYKEVDVHYGPWRPHKSHFEGTTHTTAASFSLRLPFIHLWIRTDTSFVHVLVVSLHVGLQVEPEDAAVCQLWPVVPWGLHSVSN